MDTPSPLNLDDGRIPLTVGIFAQPGPLPDDRERLRSRLSAVLVDLAQEYSHTPIVMLTLQDDLTATEVAEAAKGSKHAHQTLPAACADSLKRQCSVLIAPHNGVYRVEWRRDRQEPAQSVGESAAENPASSGHDTTPPSTFSKVAWACVTLLLPCRFKETKFASRHLLDIFNADVLRCSLDCSEEEGKALSEVEIQAAGNEKGLRRFRRWYATADGVAKHYQILSVRWVFGMFALGFLSALFLKIGYYEPTAQWSKWIYMGLLGLTSVLGLLLHYWWGYRRKYLDYRALAEGLRVALYWRYAGFNVQSVPSDDYPRLQWADLRWIRMAIRSCLVLTDPVLDPLARASSTERERLVVIQKRWIEAQRAFFARAAGRDQARFHKYRKMAWISLAAGSVIFGAYVFHLRSKCIPDFPSPLRWAFDLMQVNLSLASILEVSVCLALAVTGSRIIDRTSPRSVWLPPSGKGRGWALLLGGAVWFLLALHPILPSEQSIKDGALGQMEPGPLLEHVRNVFFVVLRTGGFLLAFVMFGYLNYLGLEKHVQRYTLMEQRYDDEQRRLGALLTEGEFEKAKNLLKSLGAEALAESGSWIELHRQKSEEDSHEP